MDGDHGRHRIVLISVFLIASIVAVYWPVYKYDFLTFDDDVYVTNNVNIHSGFNLQSIRWAFTAGYAGNWHPLTWLSHILDYQLFKKWAGGYHLENVFFHILNTLLLFYLLKKITGDLWPSAFVAAAFALHPLHIESVAWIAERKDVLSTFFCFLTIIAYVRYVHLSFLHRTPYGGAESPINRGRSREISSLCHSERSEAQSRNLLETDFSTSLIPNKSELASVEITKGGFKLYLTALILFILGLMSKPMLVTLPFVLLLLDYWPLERKFSPRLFIEKIPFFICSFAACVITYLVQRKASLAPIFESIEMAARFKNAFVSYVEYILKMIWPSNLAILYPHPGNNLPMVKVLVCCLLLVLITLFFVYYAKKYKFLIVGWLWYIGTLVPVIGFVQVGNQAMADRYAYIPLTGLFIIIVWSAKEFIPRSGYKILISLAAAILLTLGVTASHQLKYWKDSQTLFKHSIDVTQNNYMMLDNYGILLAKKGRFQEAAECFKQSLKIRPNSSIAYNNLGVALVQSGQTQQAIDCFKSAIKIYPQSVQGYLNLGDSLKKQKELKQAVYYYKKAVEISPNLVRAQLKLALTLINLKEFEAAIKSFDKVIEIEPDNIIAYGYRGIAYSSLEKYDEAIISYRQALKLDPENPDLLELLDEAQKKLEKRE